MTSRLRLVREESMAIASERLVVPSLLRGKHIDAQEAYDVGLCMTLTILSRGWFREFGLAHYLELKDVDVDFVAKIKDDGRILVRDEVEDDPPLSATEEVGRSRGPIERLLSGSRLLSMDPDFIIGDRVARNLDSSTHMDFGDPLSNLCTIVRNKRTHSMHRRVVVGSSAVGANESKRAMQLTTTTQSDSFGAATKLAVRSETACCPTNAQSMVTCLLCASYTTTVDCQDLLTLMHNKPHSRLQQWRPPQGNAQPQGEKCSRLRK